MPKFLVHGWWNIGGAKMSKSLGNVIDPDLLAEKYGPEALRYYLMGDIGTGGDANFMLDRLISRWNSDVANSIGNLLNRSLSMIARYQQSRLKMPAGEWLHNPDQQPIERYSDRISGEVRSLRSHFSMARLLPITLPFTSGPYVINAGIANIIEVSTQGNALVDSTVPWKLAKGDSELAAVKLNAVLYALAESLRIIAILISPVLPRAAHGRAPGPDGPRFVEILAARPGGFS